MVPLASLADAVGRTDSAGRHIAYTQRGIRTLKDAGWLHTETVGQKGDQHTTYFLSTGDRAIDWFPEDDADWLALQL